MRPPSALAVYGAQASVTSLTAMLLFLGLQLWVSIGSDAALSRAFDPKPSAAEHGGH